MTYLVQNNTAYISGNNGYYDNYIQNPSVRYGRNAVKNNIGYTKDIAIDKNTPFDFEYRYMNTIQPGAVDGLAVMGAAFEEMGKKPAIEADSLTRPVKEAAAQEIAQVGVKDTQVQRLAKSSDSKILDLNNDGLIDTAEYAATLIVSDMTSKGDSFNPANVTGTINKTGLNKLFALVNVNNAQNSRQALHYIYNAYNLGAYQQQFYSNPNNTLDIRG